MMRVSSGRGVVVPLLLALLTLSACSGAKDWSTRLDAIIGDNSLSAEQRIEALKDFLDEGPPDAEADQARFTIGWLFAETLEQYAEARRWFTEVVKNDPNGKWADDSQWMIDNMEKDPSDLLPDLQGRQAEEQKAIPPQRQDPDEPTPSGAPIPPRRIPSTSR